MRDTKHLGKHANKLAEQAKEKALFRTQRKAVEAGAHGTLDYTIKEGINKNKSIESDTLVNYIVSLSNIIDSKKEKLILVNTK